MSIWSKSNGCILLILLSISSSLTYAADVRKTELMFYTVDTPPFQILHKGLPTSGLSHDILEITKHEQDLSIKYDSTVPWLRAFKIVEETPNHFIYTVAKTEERESKLQWVETIYSVHSYLYSLANRDDIVIKSLMDYNNYSIAVPWGDASIQLLGLDPKDSENNQRRVFYPKSQEEAMQLLHDKKVDLIYNNELSFIQVAKNINAPTSDFKALFDGGSTDLGIYTSKLTHEDVVGKFRKTFHQLRMEGRYDELVAKWIK